MIAEQAPLSPEEREKMLMTVLLAVGPSPFPSNRPVNGWTQVKEEWHEWHANFNEWKAAAGGSFASLHFSEFEAWQCVREAEQEEGDGR